MVYFCFFLEMIWIEDYWLPNRKKSVWVKWKTLVAFASFLFSVFMWTSLQKSVVSFTLFCLIHTHTLIIIIKKIPQIPVVRTATWLSTRQWFGNFFCFVSLIYQKTIIIVHQKIGQGHFRLLSTLTIGLRGLFKELLSLS